MIKIEMGRFDLPNIFRHYAMEDLTVDLMIAELRRFLPVIPTVGMFTRKHAEDCIEEIKKRADEKDSAGVMGWTWHLATMITREAGLQISKPNGLNFTRQGLADKVARGGANSWGKVARKGRGEARASAESRLKAGVSWDVIVSDLAKKHNRGTNTISTPRSGRGRARLPVSPLGRLVLAYHGMHVWPLRPRPSHRQERACR